MSGLESRGRVLDGELELKVTSLWRFVRAVNLSENFFEKTKKCLMIAASLVKINESVQQAINHVISKGGTKWQKRKQKRNSLKVYGRRAS